MAEASGSGAVDVGAKATQVPAHAVEGVSAEAHLAAMVSNAWMAEAEPNRLVGGEGALLRDQDSTGTVALKAEAGPGAQEVASGDWRSEPLPARVAVRQAADRTNASLRVTNDKAQAAVARLRGELSVVSAKREDLVDALHGRRLCIGECALCDEGAGK